MHGLAHQAALDPVDRIDQHTIAPAPADDAFADTRIGDALKVIAGAPKKVEAVYSTPFLSHATMEPMNCTALVTPDKVEVWTATQSAEGSLAAACEEAGLPLAAGEVHVGHEGGATGADVAQHAVDAAPLALGLARCGVAELRQRQG